MKCLIIYHAMELVFQIEDILLHCLAYKLFSGPRFNNSECVPLSTTAPPSTTTMQSANLPVAHRFEVRSVAAPLLRKALITLASSTSLICDVASSSNKIEPTRLFFTVPGGSWFSFPESNCDNVLVNRIRDQSDGDKGYAGGRMDDGFSSSSLATTTVDSFDGSRERTLLPSPVICDLDEVVRSRRETREKKVYDFIHSCRQSYLHSYRHRIPFHRTCPT